MAETMTKGAERLQPKTPEAEEFNHFARNVARAAAQTPDRTAVIHEESGTRWTWAEYGDRIARMAARLQTRGVGPDVMVATLSENTPDHMALYCAIIHAGGCVVPLPFSATEEALVKMMQDCGAKLLFASPKFLDTAGRLGAGELVPLAEIDGWIGDADPVPPADPEPDHYFDMIYSSGTTGTPKGILHDHRFRSRQATRSTKAMLDGTSVTLMSTPLYSNTTLVTTLMAHNMGATTVMMSKFDTKEFLRLSEAHSVTHAILVPVQYMRLMDEPDFDKFDLSAYVCKMSTSAPLPGVLIEQVMRRWPGNLMESYGMTEGGVSCTLDCEAHPDKWDTVGQVNPGGELKIIDEDGNVLPEGSFGEIVGRSYTIMPGYHNNPEKTAEATWYDADGNVWIRTGDMGRMDEDGFLHLLDRKKDMIISGGFNIYAADLEQVLRKHPDVADVAVIAIPSREWGETPLGLVVPKRPDADPEEIRDWTNARLGKTQRVSKIVFREDMPRSEIGKILKRELRTEYLQDTPA